MSYRLVFALAVLGAAPSVHAAANCAANLEGSDAMRYNLANIDVPRSCTTFTIHLKHTGKLARAVMGHNVVIAKPADMAGIDADGMKAGLADNYIKPGDARVIAHSTVVGGGESTSVSFPVAKLGKTPTEFFCSFPGHSAFMKGTLTLKP
ncbi:azurin [Stenotrophomonas sp. YIM B06876]|uniref:azurin n=1 Tax=Stenotrophomonas sp. YIM B06876 TaxID=3060211 RepID=UPI002738C349|nr:azurin [Stenotrophomonas sp. YIM B06876]